MENSIVPRMNLAVEMSMPQRTMLYASRPDIHKDT
jgi:hypothetical protein